MAKDPILIIGAGRMGGALLKGWLAKGLMPVIAVEPNPSPALKAMARKGGVTIVPSIDAVKAKRVRACAIALKPQILKDEAVRLKAIAARTVTISPRRPCGSGALMLGCDGEFLEMVDGIQEHACIHATIPWVSKRPMPRSPKVE